MKKSNLTLLLSFLPILSLFSQTINTVTPGTAIQGQTLQVTISGQGTMFTQTSTTSWISQGVVSINPVSTTAQSYTVLHSTYSIPINASVGYWDLHVLDGTAGELLKLDAIFIDEFIGVDPRGATVKESVRLGPNPASDHFTLGYSLPSKAWVNIEVKDLKGATLAHVYTGDQAPGAHAQTVLVSDLGLPNGVYLVTLQVDKMVFAIKTAINR